MDAIPTLNQDIIAFHELWDRRYQIIGSDQINAISAKVVLNDRVSVELECCKYDFGIFLVVYSTPKEGEDVIAIRRMDSGAIYSRLSGRLTKLEDVLDYSKENYPEFFEFIIANTGCNF